MRGDTYLRIGMRCGGALVGCGTCSSRGVMGTVQMRFLGSVRSFISARGPTPIVFPDDFREESERPPRQTRQVPSRSCAIRHMNRSRVEWVSTTQISTADRTHARTGPDTQRSTGSVFASTISRGIYFENGLSLNLYNVPSTSARRRVRTGHPPSHRAPISS